MIQSINLLAKNFVRYLHIDLSRYAVEKSLLASLRKKTGYTFSNCKKALELHNNDLKKAEEWLRKQAQEQGWAKAMKLEGRQTSQGLVGVAVDKNKAALVEVNCETDFVARNEEFKKVVEEAVKTCLIFTETQQQSKPLVKINLTSEQLKSLPTPDGKSLADKLALMIGMLGENASLKRALCIKTDDDICLASYAHPASSVTSPDILLGKFAGVVALKSSNNVSDIYEISRGICQHIVGMAPTKIGTSDDEPAKNKEEETCLIHQDYLLDDNLTVKEILEENEVQVIDFSRFECGENILGDQPLDLVETCQ